MALVTLSQWHITLCDLVTLSLVTSLKWVMIISPKEPMIVQWSRIELQMHMHQLHIHPINPHRPLSLLWIDCTRCSYVFACAHAHSHMGKHIHTHTHTHTHSSELTYQYFLSRIWLLFFIPLMWTTISLAYFHFILFIGMWIWLIYYGFQIMINCLVI